MGWEDPLEEEIATHSSILAWRIPWTEEPGRSQMVRCCTAHMHTLMPIMYNEAFIKTGRAWVWVYEHMETQGNWHLEKT